MYLVLGSYGDYDTFDRWPVAVFSDKSEAEKYAWICQETTDNPEDKEYTVAPIIMNPTVDRSEILHCLEE